MTPGPEVLIPCINFKALLGINQQYVVGVGGICSAISDWSSLESYSSSEL